MKKRICLIVCVAAMLLMVCGCSDSGSKEAKETKASITSEWEIVSFTLPSGEVLSRDKYGAQFVEFADKLPSFSCPDGVNCYMAMNGQIHKGTIKEVGDGVYEIDDKKHGMKSAYIVGDELTLVNEKGDASVKFKMI